MRVLIKLSIPGKDNYFFDTELDKLPAVNDSLSVFNQNMTFVKNDIPLLDIQTYRVADITRAIRLRDVDQVKTYEYIVTLTSTGPKK